MSARPSSPPHSSGNLSGDLDIAAPRQGAQLRRHPAPARCRRRERVQGDWRPLVGLDETADQRSDLFALGVVLYEMLTGRRAFAHGSAVETMSAILREEPPEIETLG